MTYHLEPWVGKILSPVVLIYPDGERRGYDSGKAVAEEIFQRPYIIMNISTAKDTIELSLIHPPHPDISFF